MISHNKKAQAILEYSVFIVCFIAALVSMSVYIKRGISGKLRGVSDDIGRQYAPGKMDTSITITESGTQTSNTTMEQRDFNGDGTLSDEEWVSVTQFSIPDEDGKRSVSARSGYEALDPSAVGEKDLWD